MRPESEIDYSSLSRDVVKNESSFVSSPHMPSYRGQGRLHLLSLIDAKSTVEDGAGFSTETWSHAAHSSWLQVIADCFVA